MEGGGQGQKQGDQLGYYNTLGEKWWWLEPEW